jgi:glutamine---fructose-6-phosphate transaminase (isomerizing)
MASTLSEIMSQPSVWKAILQKPECNLPWIKEQELNNDSVIYFIGCGTSFYLAIAAAANYSRLTGRCARPITSSDLLFFPELFTCNDKTRAVTISRSGETTETVWATELLVKNNIPTLGVTCQPDSSLTKCTHYNYIIPEANEHSVVMTRSFTGMLLYLQRFAAIRANNRYFLEELERLPEIGQKLINEKAHILKDLSTSMSFSIISYLGQGAYYGLASESMLKLKEMSLTNTEVFHSLEFRHGPKSVANEYSLVIILLSDSAKEHEIKLARELKIQKAKVVLIGENIPNEINNIVDVSIDLRSGLSEYARMVLLMPLTQLFAYERAISKELNPDSPLNLSKVVTLEGQ